MALTKRIGVVGLGYVGLPVAVGFAEKYKVIGFDVDEQKINALKNGHDPNGQFSTDELQAAAIDFTLDECQLSKCHYIIVAVPTPITSLKEPDLSYLEKASATIGRNLSPGTVVVYESTVYPGTTETICIPILEKNSHLIAGKDFYVGYSPERINPGDQEHTFQTNPKIIAGQNEQALEQIYEIYHNVLFADIHKAPSIKVAEAAKIVENTQRDINIAFMNELALIFNKLGIDTYDVIAAAKTKWNFIPMSPGLVGGHCIGVDPYYLIHESKRLGYMPTFISAAREINESMPKYVVQSLLQLIIRNKLDPNHVRITVLGITFKENISDTRNSKALEIVHSLHQLGLSIQVCDPYIDPSMFQKWNNIEVKPLNQLDKADIVVLTVPHREFKQNNFSYLPTLLKDTSGIIMDIKGVVPKELIKRPMHIWTF